MKNAMSREHAVSYLCAQGFSLPEQSADAQAMCLRSAQEGDVVAQCVLSVVFSAGLNPENWHGAHRVPGWIATGVGGLAIATAIAINVQGSRTPDERPSRSVQSSAEERAEFERQAKSKIEPLIGKPYAPTLPAR